MSHSGTLKSFNTQRGFGFISSGEQEYFVHKSAIQGRPPKEGDVLSFDTEPSKKDPSKMEAQNVTGGTCGGASQGTVKFFNEYKGYGFIEQEGAAEGTGSHFMHANDITGGTPMEGDTVWFDIVPSDKDPSKTAAKNVAGGSGYAMAAKGGGKGYGKMDMYNMMMMWYGMGGKGGWKGGGKGGGGGGGACHQFAKGSCSYGDSCRFSHSL